MMRACFAFATLLASCAGEPLAPRASFDLDCPADRLSYTELGEDTWGVRGCGRQGTYMWSCDRRAVPNGQGGFFYVKKCQWVRN